MVDIDSNFFMNLALNEAWKYQGLTYPNPAVGCCIVGEYGEILALKAHQKAGEPHAEVLALQEAYFKYTNDSAILQLTSSFDIHTFLLKNSNDIFKKSTVYTTLEPCSHIGKTPSCASLLKELKVKKVLVGTDDFNKQASCGNILLQDSGVEVETNILQKESEALLYPFRRFLHDNFIFFKWAQRLNGTVDDGNVSSLESRTHVHSLRDVCDLLVIGGNTVREDRPRLDARLVDGKAPDVLIVSRSRDIDKTIPLFAVKGRSVYIENSFDRLQEYKNIMIEGTATMYELTKDRVDYYLCYLAPTFGGNVGFSNVEDRFEILNYAKENQDIIMWMKRI